MRYGIHVESEVSGYDRCIMIVVETETDVWALNLLPGVDWPTEEYDKVDVHLSCVIKKSGNKIADVEMWYVNVLDIKDASYFEDYDSAVEYLWDVSKNPDLISLFVRLFV